MGTTLTTTKFILNKKVWKKQLVLVLFFGLLTWYWFSITSILAVFGLFFILFLVYLFISDSISAKKHWIIMSPENIQIPIQVGFLETEGLQEKIDKPDFLYIQDKKIVIPWKDITAIWEEGDLVGNPLLTVCTEIACLSFSLSGFEIPKIFEELEEHVQGEVFLENAKSNALISKEKEVIFTNVRQSNPKKFIKNFKRPKTTIVFSTIFILFLSWSFYPSLSEAFNLRNIIFFLVVCSPIIWVFLTINREITITETYIELSDYIQKFRIYWNEIEKVSFLTEDRTIVFEGDKKRLMLPWGVWYEKTFFDDYYYFLLSYCEEYKIKFSSKGFYFLPNKNTWVRK